MARSIDQTRIAATRARPWLVAIWPIVLAFVLYVHCDSQFSSCGAEKTKEKKANSEQDESYVCAPFVYRPDQASPDNKAPEAANSHPMRQCSPLCGVVAKTIDDPVALFTLVLSYFVYLQVVWMARQESVLKESLDATRKTVESFVTAERARIFITVELRTYEISKEHGQVPMIRIIATNHGKTAASIVKITSYLRAGAAKPITCPPASDDDLIREGIGIPATGTYVFGPKGVDLKSFSPKDELNLDVKWWCFGTFDYRDIFRDTRITGFCFECAPRSGRGFEFSHDSPLNYQT